jgi:dGTPase
MKKFLCDTLLKKFLMQKMYRHPLVNLMTDNAKTFINSLFDFHFFKPEILPKERYEEYLQNKNPQNLAEIICDYIAGMTDRFALREHERLTGRRLFDGAEAAA